MKKRIIILLSLAMSVCVMAKVAVDAKKEAPIEVPKSLDKTQLSPEVSTGSPGMSEKKESVNVEKKKSKTSNPDHSECSNVSEDVSRNLDIKKEVKKQPQETVNKIAVVIYTDDEPIMITKHSLDCKTLDGRVRSKDELVMEKLMCHEAINYYKIPITDDMVDKHLASLKEMHGIGDAEIKKLFKEAGYTYEEGREQLRSSYAIQSLMGQLVDGRVVVTEKEVKAFYDKNPPREKASFRIQTAFIKDGELTDMQVQDLVEDGLYKELVVWNSPYWLEVDEIVESKKYITSMKPGEIRSEKVKDGYQVVMLVKRKKERTLAYNECRSDITGMLRMQSRQKLFKDYEKELLNKYDIVYMV